MLLYGCLYMGVSGPLIQYLKIFKKFSLGAELQPLRATPTMGFPQTCHFLEAGQGGRWGCGPEQLAATVPCASVKVPFPPNSFSTMAEITPTTSLVVELPSRQGTQRVMCHNTNSRTVIQITKKCTTLTVRVFTHTHTHTHTHTRGARTVVAHWAKQRGEVTCPCMTMNGEK